MLILALAGIPFEFNSAELETHIGRGIKHLILIQKADGSFGNPEAPTGDVGTTGLAVQALATSTCDDDRVRLRAIGLGLRFLESRIQKDGLAYDPNEGLRVFKTAMAAQAFRVSNTPRYRMRSLELSERIGSAARFESHSREGEWKEGDPDSSRDADRLRDIATLGGTDGSTDRALAFLLQLEHSSAGVEVHSQPLPADGQSGYLSYESLPALIYRDLSLDDPDVIAVLKALREQFTVSENPDLTRRFSRQSKAGGEQGLYFNFYTIARVLSLLPNLEFVTDSGESHDWTSELSKRILSLQRADGSWANSNPRWWEGSPALTTSYAILALRQCQARRSMCSDQPPMLDK